MMCNVCVCWCGNKDMLVVEGVKDANYHLMRLEDDSIYLSSERYTRHYHNEKEFFVDVRDLAGIALKFNQRK